MDTTQLTFLGYGVLVGLAVALWVAISAWRRRRAVEAELRRLRQHLADQMEITHEGAQQRKAELDRLRQENENLRITLKTWQQKPDRRELRMLQVYDHAVHQLLASAPGFSPHWETALRDAEREVAQIDSGIVAFARRLVLPLSGSTKRREPGDE
jgi:hypothetical protein